MLKAKNKLLVHKNLNSTVHLNDKMISVFFEHNFTLIDYPLGRKLPCYRMTCDDLNMIASDYLQVILNEQTPADKKLEYYGYLVTGAIIDTALIYNASIYNHSGRGTYIYANGIWDHLIEYLITAKLVNTNNYLSVRSKLSPVHSQFVANLK